MSYNMVVLVLATLFRVGRVWGGARDFLCGVSDQPVSPREPCTLAFDRLVSRAPAKRCTGARRPRVNLPQEMGPSRARITGNYPHPVL